MHVYRFAQTYFYRLKLRIGSDVWIFLFDETAFILNTPAKFFSTKFSPTIMSRSEIKSNQAEKKEGLVKLCLTLFPDSKRRMERFYL